MKEKTHIRHKLKNNIDEYCSETLDREYWGSDYWRMTCNKCGFAALINNETFLKWQYCDEVVKY